MSQPGSSDKSMEQRAVFHSDSGARGVRPHEDLVEFYSNRESRAGFVSRLFDETARYYDSVSSAISFGTGKAHRKRALRLAGLKPGMRLLDVATGTGLTASAALELGLTWGDVVGLDPSRGMLEENQKRHPIGLLQGYGERLPFRDESFEFVSMGYALRHVEDLDVLFAELYRVLKRDGRVLILELTRPESRLGFWVGRFYLSRFLPSLMRLWTRSRETGRLLEYYWATIAACVPPDAILAAMKRGGFGAIERRTMGSFVSDYFGIKPGVLAGSTSTA